VSVQTGQKREPAGGCKHIIKARMQAHSTDVDTADGGYSAADVNHSSPAPEEMSQNIKSSKDAYPATNIDHSNSISEEKSQDVGSSNSEVTNRIQKPTSAGKTEQSTSTENSSSLTQSIAGGFVLAILFTLGIGLLMFILDISLGTMTTWFIIILVVIESSVVIDHISVFNKNQQATSGTDQSTATTEAPKASGNSPDVSRNTTESSNNQYRGSSTGETSTTSSGSPDHGSDDAWLRREYREHHDDYHDRGR